MQTREREKNLAAIGAASILFQLVERRDSDRVDAIQFSILICSDHWQATLNDTIFVLDAFTKMVTYTSGGGKSRKKLVDACAKLIYYLEMIRAEPFLLDVHFLRYRITRMNVSFIKALSAHTGSEQNVFLKCMVEALGHITPIHERLLGDESPAEDSDRDVVDTTFIKDEVM